MPNNEIMKRRNLWIIFLLILCLPMQSMALGFLPCVHDGGGQRALTDERMSGHLCMHMEQEGTQDESLCASDGEGQNCATCLHCHLCSVYSLAGMPIQAGIPTVTEYARLSILQFPYHAPDLFLRPPQTSLI